MPNRVVNSKWFIVNRDKKIPHEPNPVARSARSTWHCILHINYKPAFTLIELLIVITIIGVLASLSLATYGGAQSKARDGVRKSDLAQVKRALELVKADCSGSGYYPNNGGADGALAYTALGTYLSDVDLKYISSMPKDPKNINNTAPAPLFPPQPALPASYYGYATSTTTASKCPNPDGLGGAPTIAGADYYSLWAIMEQGQKDSQGTDSRTKCAPTTFPTPNGGVWSDAQYNGYYVICNN